MKRALVFGVTAVAVAISLITPVSAQNVVRESSCTATYGSNNMTYDCGFNVKDYVVGSPVTFTVNYNCSGYCGPVMSFGLRDKGFSPAGVAGHMVGGKRVPNGIELTFVFDSLKAAGKGSIGNAHFKMNVMADDGSGSLVPVPCNVNVHLNEER